MKTWETDNRDRLDSNQFWWQQQQSQYLYFTKKRRDLFRDLKQFENAPVLPPQTERSIDWYLEQYTRPVKDTNGQICPGVSCGVTWEAQLRYMSGCVVGELILRRAGVDILSLADQVRFNPLKDTDPRREEYLDYVEASRVKWQAYLEYPKTAPTLEELAATQEEKNQPA
jgi:hypothetical protein